jgi:hypothetical protein
MGHFVKDRNLESATSSVVIPSGTSATRPDNPVFGSFRYNTDIGKLEFFNGAVYKTVGISGEVNIVVDTFTGDGATTTFAMSQYESGVNQIIVFVGAIYQNPTTYTLTGAGHDITFTSAPPNGETINIVHNTASTAVS